MAINWKEYQNRLTIIKAAQNMFPDEKNITIALQKYKNKTGSDIEVIISTKEHGNRPSTMFDIFERIPCPECDSDLMFRNIPDNDEGYHTQLLCSNKNCDYAINSEYTLSDWIKVLKRKDDI